MEVLTKINRFLVIHLSSETTMKMELRTVSTKVTLTKKILCMKQ